MDQNFFRDHEYKWTKPYTSVRHQWSFRGVGGGLHFHVSNYEGNVSAGLEFHHDDSIDEGPAHNKNCWLTGGKCWHMGTSLYAVDYVWPIVEGYLNKGKHEEIFKLLEHEYKNHMEQHHGSKDAQK